ncbi:MAG TPA: hypothetical protein VF106_29065, partial [Actinophytocola sp.]
MSRSWAEVKRLLDDPYVDADTKEELLVAYAMENDEDDRPAEFDSYADNYSIDSDDIFFGDGRLARRGTDAIAREAQEESDEAGYNARLNNEAVESGRGDIEGMQAPAEGSSVGVQKSDEIFDAARPALRLWEDFLPINDKVPGDSLGRHGKINLEED